MMKRNTRSRQKRFSFHGRLGLFLAGGMMTVLLIITVLISLDRYAPVRSSPTDSSLTEKTPGKAVISSTATDPLAVPPPSPAPETFTFYDTLSQSDPSHPEFSGSTPESLPPASLLPKTLITPKGSPTPPGPRYTVQVAALRDRSAAEALVARLKKKGYPVYINSHITPHRGTWFRVRVGRSIDRKAAQKLAQRLSGSERLTPFITPED